MKGRIINEARAAERKFPKLMRSEQTGDIYLMTSRDNGVRVFSSGSPHGRIIGMSVNHMKEYPLVDFNGAVELSNE